MFGLILLLLLFAVASVGPYLTKWSYEQKDFESFLRPPSGTTWFGTDQVGADLYTQTVRGMQKSPIIGLLTAVFATGLAAVVGATAGYFGGWLDRVLMWGVDRLLVLPAFLIQALVSPVFRGAQLVALRAVGRGVNGDQRGVPGPCRARRRRRRVSRQTVAGARHDVHDPATGQRRLYDLAPAPTGKRGRRALKSAKLGKPVVLAAGAAWGQVTMCRYGRREQVWAADIGCIWYGSFGNTPGRCVLVRDDDSAKVYDLALFTVDADASMSEVIERYAVRWSIEPSNANGKQHMGVGQARNRLPKAVARTVPFGMLVQSLVIVWYALHGYHHEDVTARRREQPWYDSKTEPSFDDILVKLRKTLIAARFSAVSPGQSNPDLLRDYALACAAAAA